jgi:signal transduction histidine kinase
MPQRTEIQPKVLVVDDTPANLVAMQAVLQPLKVEIVEASSGQDALEVAVQQPTFAVALIDVQMPRMDGFDLAAHLRAMPEFKELPIIFVTAIHRDERYVREGYAAGAADYITKPFDPDMLRARVGAFIDLFRQRERLRVAQVTDALEQLEKLLERERAARHDAEVANAEKDEFVAIVSHELRTPLTSMLGWATMARKLAPGPDLDRALETIERNARAQMRLVDDLLEMSRTRTGKLRIDLAEVSVDETIESAVAALAPLAEQRHVRVEVSTRAGVVRADGNRVKQVVSNLLSNAIKFTPSGGEVFVQAERRDGIVEIAVRDTGEGIAPEFLSHVFEPFKQAGAGQTRKGGLGLGLAIVRQLVEAHGGQIRAESEGLGRGAKFVVELPANN